jgi:glyoxylase-like metal-dependent hydrolase (beta-lactamase superfamily II)
VEEGADRDFCPDVIVKDGDVIAGDDFTFTGVATPGHTANHMCYALEEEQALFCGDHVMGWSTSVVAPPDGDMADYLTSLDRLIARGDKILYPTHGSPIATPQDYLRELRAHRMMREMQILESLRPGDDTAATLAARLYPGLDPKLRAAAASQVQAHLDHLKEKGAVALLPGARYARISR